MGKMPNKKLKIHPEGEQSSGVGGMEQLSNHAGEGLAVENANSAVKFVGLGVFPEEVRINLVHFDLLRDGKGVDVLEF